MGMLGLAGFSGWLLPAGWDVYISSRIAAVIFTPPSSS